MFGGAVDMTIAAWWIGVAVAAVVTVAAVLTPHREDRGRLGSGQLGVGLGRPLGGYYKFVI